MTAHLGRLELLEPGTRRADRGCEGVGLQVLDSGGECMGLPDAREMVSARELAGSHDGVATSPDAIAFVRFCYERRPVAWPELYDEMTMVAARGLFRGWGYLELADHGIGLALPDLPRLAAVACAIARRGAPVENCPAPEPGG